MENVKAWADVGDTFTDYEMVWCNLHDSIVTISGTYYGEDGMRRCQSLNLTAKDIPLLEEAIRLLRGKG